MIRKYILGVVCVCAVVAAQAQRYHCERDTALAMEIIREFSEPGGDPGKLCGQIASKFVGVPYAPVAQEDSLGVAEIRLDGFDDFSFVNNVAALAKLATSPGSIRLKDVEQMIERMTFRRGEANGFPSRMLYGGDWVVDNRSRGNIKELTEDYSTNFKTKSLEYVGRHPDEYVALKDSATLDRQKMVEFGYRTFKIPHLKRESTEWKNISSELREGDLIMLLTSHPEKDLWEMGYLVIRPDGLHLIRVSEKDGKVVEEQAPIGRFSKRNAKEIYGCRW
ncbi:MAG: DUF1460 domain-containing protein, partial [Muribaculaceae bacterium]|nr:DUF1460 domain-containing protein [Muribaculaceae bacterium]